MPLLHDSAKFCIIWSKKNDFLNCCLSKLGLDQREGNRRRFRFFFVFFYHKLASVLFDLMCVIFISVKKLSIKIILNTPFYLKYLIPLFGCLCQFQSRKYVAVAIIETKCSAYYGNTEEIN